MARRTDLPPEILRRASRIRGVAYAIAGAAVVFIAYCLVAGALDGLDKGLARDPYTGALVNELDEACETWAERLLTAEESQREDARYHVQVTSWRMRCRHVASAPASELLEREPRLRLR